MEENDENTTSFKLFCAICRGFVKNTDIIYCTSRCGHVFHGDCILKWFDYGCICPLCSDIGNKYIVHRLILNPNIENKSMTNETEPYNKSFYWMKLEEHVTAEEMQKYAFQLGLDPEGDPVFAARVEYEMELLPAYYVPKLKGVLFGKDLCQSECLSENIEILRIDKDDADYNWVVAADGAVPENSFLAGFCDLGKPLYIVRQLFENQMCYGCLRPTHDGAYIVYEEYKEFVSEYEVLIRIPRSKKEGIK